MYSRGRTSLVHSTVCKQNQMTNMSHVHTCDMSITIKHKYTHSALIYSTLNQLNDTFKKITKILPLCI